MTAFTNTSYGVKNIGTTPTPIINGVPSGTMAIASLIISNTTTAPITTTVYVTRATQSYYLIYQATIPVGGSLEVVQGSRVVLQTGDVLGVINSAPNSGDAWVSALTAV